MEAGDYLGSNWAFLAMKNHQVAWKWRSQWKGDLGGKIELNGDLPEGDR